MRGIARLRIFIVLLVLVATVALSTAMRRAALVPPTGFTQDAAFKEHIIDAHGPNNSHCKGIGDFNGDEGTMLVCSAGGQGIYWYENPGGDATGQWTKHTIRSSGRYSTDMEVADIDGDGRPDIVIPKSTDGNFGNDVYWYKNPGGNATARWTEHHIGEAGAHDVQVGDLSGNGMIDVVVRLGPATIFLNQGKGERWKKVTINVPGHEGTVIGDFDGDGTRISRSAAMVSDGPRTLTATARHGTCMKLVVDGRQRPAWRPGT